MRSIVNVAALGFRLSKLLSVRRCKKEKFCSLLLKLLLALATIYRFKAHLLCTVCLLKVLKTWEDMLMKALVLSAVRTLVVLFLC